MSTLDVAPAQSAMAVLLVELQDLVLELLEHQDHKSLRLTNRSWSVASNRYVFRHFRLCWFEFSIDKLYKIARSPLGKHLHAITVYADMIHPDAATYDSRYSTGHHWYRQLTEADLRFLEPFQAQLIRASTTTRRPWLVKSFQSLPALKEVVITRFLDHGPWVGRIHELLYRQNPNAEHSDREESSAREAVDCKDITLENLAIQCNRFPVAPDHSEVRASVAVSWILEAIGRRERLLRHPAVRTLSVGAALLHEVCSDRDLRPNANKPVLEQVHMISNALEEVKTMELILPVRNYLDRSPRKRLRDASLTRLLTSARNLSSLTIDWASRRTHPEDNDSFIGLARFIRRHPPLWPQLQRLQLRGMLLSDRDLIDMLRTHKATLKHLHLIHLCVENPMFIIHSIPRHLKLETVQVEFLMQATWAIPVLGMPPHKQWSVWLSPAEHYVGHDGQPSPAHDGLEDFLLGRGQWLNVQGILDGIFIVGYRL